MAGKVKDSDPKSNVAFLKMHKAGSTTIANVILRYALVHQLNVALPRYGNMLGYPKVFHRSFVDERLNKVMFDVLCSHVVWNTHQVQRTVGKNVRTFTILRDPVERFVSFWDHYQLGSERALARFALDPNGTKTPHSEWLPMHLELGCCPDGTLWNSSSIIEYTEKTFELVLIHELWDESMVILWRFLHWDLKDLAYFPHLRRQPGTKTMFSPKTRTLLRDWLTSDNDLYLHFSVKFQSYKVNSTLTKDVEQLQAIQADVLKHCEVQTLPNVEAQGVLRKKYDSFFMGYSTKNTTECVLMAMPEESLVEIIRRKQSRKFHLQ